MGEDFAEINFPIAIKNKCSYKIKESQNCDSFIIRPSGGQPDGHVRFDNGNSAHYNGSNL